MKLSLIKNKVNPIYKLQNDLAKMKIIFGLIDEDDGKLEVNDKQTYTIIEKIYNLGVESRSKASLKSKIFWAGIALFIGLGIGMIIGLFI